MQKAQIQVKSKHHHNPKKSQSLDDAKNQAVLAMEFPEYLLKILSLIMKMLSIFN